jgi:hypothetical protein
MSKNKKTGGRSMKKVFALGFVCAMAVMLQANAQQWGRDRDDDRRSGRGNGFNLGEVLEPGDSIDVGYGAVLTNRGRRTLLIEEVSLRPLQQQPQPPPNHGRQFEVSKYPVPKGTIVDCQDQSIGGRYGAELVQCVDIGDGRNHSCTPASRTGCVANEGSGNGGSAGCKAICER